MVLLDHGWHAAFVVVPGCGASAKVAIRWLKENGVTTVEGVFPDGSMMLKGAQEWIRNMRIRSVVVGEKWRGTIPLLHLTSVGTHVMYWRRFGEENEYRQAHGVWKFSDGAGGVRLRFEARNGLRIYYNEEMDGMGLLSFIGRGYAGNGIISPEMHGGNVRLPLE